jgi:hypothetical protein
VLAFTGSAASGPPRKASAASGAPRVSSYAVGGSVVYGVGIDFDQAIARTARGRPEQAPRVPRAERRHDVDAGSERGRPAPAGQHCHAERHRADRGTSTTSPAVEIKRRHAAGDRHRSDVTLTPQASAQRPRSAPVGFTFHCH